MSVYPVKGLSGLEVVRLARRFTEGLCSADHRARLFRTHPLSAEVTVADMEHVAADRASYQAMLGEIKQANQRWRS